LFLILFILPEVFIVKLKVTVAFLNCLLFLTASTVYEVTWRLAMDIGALGCITLSVLVQAEGTLLNIRINF